LSSIWAFVVNHTVLFFGAHFVQRNLEVSTYIYEFTVRVVLFSVGVVAVQVWHLALLIAFSCDDQNSSCQRVTAACYFLHK